MRVTVLGLWHLGCVTASCLAEAGHSVVGLDLDAKVVGDLQQGKPPLHEPGLAELIGEQSKRGTLSFITDASTALSDAEVLWVAFDTPVNDNDEADVAWVRGQLDTVADYIRPGTLVLVSSQVPVGFTASLERAWAGRGLRFAVSPENLRLGKALDCFRKPERVVVGCRAEASKALLQELFKPFCENLVWMSIESAEMTKHALNAFLATSVTFINELSRICEAVGADAKEVERGLKSESRIGPKAYLSPGAAFAGGTLARDIRFLIDLAQKGKTGAPLFQGVWDSNNIHKEWVQSSVKKLLNGCQQPVVAVLGLTYKPGTSTLRRSSAVELCRWLHKQDVCVKGLDPAISALPADLDTALQLCETPASALAGADVAVIATEWPEFRALPADLFVRQMRSPCVIDQNHFLAQTLGSDRRIRYQATGVKPLAA
ncbi:MAG TPA: nucleotide sugar dehydrogenase [Gemmataceae bacterium]|nr:nucleotide sugar dehydrogenase [Gemmataceae bacterium]